MPNFCDTLSCATGQARSLAPCVPKHFWGGNSSSTPPRCARRATSWHRGCNSEPSPTLRRARIAQQAHHLDIDPLRPEWTGPYTTCRFLAMWKNSSGSVILARRKAVLGIVFPALYGYAPGHTPISRWEILAFRAAVRPCSREMAGGPWAMRTRKERALLNLCNAPGLR